MTKWNLTIKVKSKYWYCKIRCTYLFRIEHYKTYWNCDNIGWRSLRMIVLNNKYWKKISEKEFTIISESIV